MKSNRRAMLAEEAGRLLAEGAGSLREIAASLGVPYTTAYKWHRGGFQIRPVGRPRSGENAHDRRRRLAADRKAKAGAESHRARERRKAGRRRKRRERERAKVRAEVRRLWQEGWTGPELAGRFGLAKSTISGLVAGLPSRIRLAERSEIVWPYPRRRYAGFRPPPAHLPSKPDGPPDPADRLGGYAAACKGEAHGRAKLDEAAVLEMRRLKAQGSTTAELALRFGVSGNTAGYAIQGVTWGHLPGAIPSEKGGRR